MMEYCMFILLSTALVLQTCSAVQQEPIWADVNSDFVPINPGRGTRHQIGLEEDKIHFPGRPDSTEFETYGGYVTVDESAGRALYYVLASAEQDTESAPVVLWLNGGPGCSSLGGGLMSELGPYFPNKDGGLKLNTHRWNKIANMIFLESPAFVGFSYSNTTSDRAVGDTRTAADTVQFLIGFFKKYPDLADRKFYISGESYGGHYVPTLALAIHEHNKGGSDTIKLQGFMVGNAWTDAAIDNRGAVDYWWSHAIISDHARDGIIKYCDFSSIGPLMDTMLCDAAVNEAFANMGNINIYDIYVDVCIHKSARGPAAALGKRLLGSPAGMSTRLATLREDNGSYDPCIDDEVEVYFNRADVQTAMHSNSTGEVPGPWKDCSDIVDYSIEDLRSSMIPVYNKLLETGMDMLVYSGDVDAIVPVIGTRRWINALGLDVVKAWQPWLEGDQVAGYVEKYQGLTLATVRDSGHMVPYTQPARALKLFKNFLSGLDFGPMDLHLARV